MRIVKNINNNVSICKDMEGRELIAFGKGIGFIKPPNEVPLQQINKTFYDLDSTNFEALKNISANIVNTAIDIIKMVEKDLSVNYTPLAFVSLADHIDFMIKREKNNLDINLINKDNLKINYPEIVNEMPKVVNLIHDNLSFEVKNKERYAIALHLINNQTIINNATSNDDQKLIKRCINTINDIYGKKIKQESYDYTRFITHLEHLISKSESIEITINNNNLKISKILSQDDPKLYESVKKINKEFEKQKHIQLTENEKLYLMIHINKGWGNI